MYKNEKSVVYIVTTDKEVAPAQHGGTISKNFKKLAKRGSQKSSYFKDHRELIVL